MSKKILSIITFFFLVFSSSAHSNSWCITSLDVDWFPEEAFKRISEYFTCRENTSGDLIVRSQPDCRGGLYFVTRFNQNLRCLPESSRVKLTYIHSESPQKNEIIFPIIKNNVSSQTLYAGLTGSDWDRDCYDLVAWKLELLDCNDNVLACRKSFLF